MSSEAKIEREREWRGHLAAWKISGLSQAAYCRRHGLTQNDFSWWKRDLARRDLRPLPSSPAFIPVRVSALSSQLYPFELVLRGGRVLRFDARADATVLGAMVRELETAVPQPGAGAC